MTEGPTTTGSIDAKLTLDTSEFDRKATEAKSTARDLGALSPSIKVDANVAGAMTELAGLQALEERLDATNVRLTVTEKGLATERSSGAASAARLAAAVAVLDEEQAQATSTALRLATVEKMLAESHQAAARAAGEEAAASGAMVAATTQVEAAGKRLEAAQRAQLNTSGALSLAEMRYQAVMEKSGRTDLQVAAAEEALARARRNDQAAAERSAAAEAALNAARSEAARKALEAAAADDASTEATKRSTEANNQRVSGVQVLLGLLPAIVAAAAPVGAAAIGLGTAFGMMGVAGALAVHGIKDAMEVGDGVGNQYAADLGSLKGNLDNLAGTAANGMLKSFNTVVGDLNGSMPFLNRTVGEFSGMLGQVGGTALSGLLTGLERLDPLLIAGGAELSKFVGWLSGMTGSNGFTDFMNYAVNNLPPVMHLIEGLVSLAGNILAAFAPLGPVVVAVLSGITDALNALPLPVLTGVVSAALLVGPAFTVAKAAVSTFGETAALSALQVEVFGTAINLAVPVVGILLAAVAGIGIAWAASAASNQAASTAMSTYTAELERTNGVIDESIQKAAAKQLVDSGAAAAAQQLGFGTQQLTGYVLGNADAHASLDAKIKAVKDAYESSTTVVDDYGNVTHIVSKAQQDQYDAATKLEGALHGQQGAFDQAKANQELYKGAVEGTNGAMTEQGAQAQIMAGQYGATVAQYDTATQSQQTAADQLAQTTLKMQLQNDAAGLLKQAWDSLNGKTMSAAQAQNAFDSSLVNMGDHVDKTGKKIHFTTTSIDDMSAASVALRGQLNGQVANLEGVIEANGGLSNSTEAAKAQYADMRQKIIDNAVAHGVDRDAVTQYIDKVMQIPKSVPPTQIDVNTSEAEKKLAGFQSAINSLTGKTVNIYSVEHISQVRDGPAINGVGGNEVANSMAAANAFATGASGYATGGIIRHLATGGWSDITGGGPITGPGTDTSDSVPLMGSANEFMIKAASVRSIGPANLEYMNRTGQLPARGVPVPGNTVVNHYHTWNVTETVNPDAVSQAVTRRLDMLTV